MLALLAASVRSGVHRALDEMTPPALHLPHTVMQAVREGRAPRRSRALPRVAVALAVVLSLAVLGDGLAMFTAPSREQAPSRPGAPPRGLLVVTTWTPDPSASYPETPYPGYRPAISPITSSMVTGASVARTPDGESAVLVDLDPQGAEVFRKLWVQAEAACPQSDCPQRHLTMWVDLTQDDVGHWNERAHQLYRPFYQGGKLLSDPSVMTPPGTTGGPTGTPVQITGNLSQRAEDLAHRLNP